jgi:hypothetical protein
MQTIQEINRAIIAGSFTATELASLQDAVKFARSKTTSDMGFALKTGAKARLTHAKLGGTVVVTISKVKLKKADVVVDRTGARYTVPLSMLEAA